MMHWLANLLGIGKITLVDDSGDLQLVQVTQGAVGKGFADRVTDKVRRITEFGFSSVPPLKSEVLTINRGADRARPTAIATSHRPSRPKNLGAGDVILYRAHGEVRGAFIWLKDGVIQIDADAGDVMIQNAATVTVKASTKIRLETLEVETTGDFVSRCDGTPVSLNGLRDAYAAHHHTGVSTGSGLSGPTDHSA